jgi:hypothetical protein
LHHDLPETVFFDVSQRIDEQEFQVVRFYGAPDMLCTSGLVTSPRE